MTFYSEPVFGNNFFAREDILNSLLKAAKDIREGYRHNLALIGRGLIGKSSLLLHFFGIIKDYERLIPIYINLKGLSFNEFVDNFIILLLYHNLKKYKKLKKDGGLDYLKAHARKIFPKTYDLIKRIDGLMNDKDYNEAFSSLWDLNVVLSSEAGTYPVVALDEFNLISSFPLKKPFQVLGQKVMVQSKTLFILSSSNTITAKNILSERLSLLFGAFGVIDIGPFAPQEAKTFIERSCKGINIPDTLKHFLLVFTGGHPFYLSTIIEKLKFAKRHGKTSISSKYLSQVIAELLFYPSGAINQFFRYLLQKVHSKTPDGDIFDLLKTILVTGHASDITSKFTSASNQLYNLLDMLLELGLIAKSGSLYAITDTAFRMWVEIKSQPRNLCFDFMPREEIVGYVKEVEEKISHFRYESSKRFDERVVELVKSFNNDQFFIDERVRVLPHLNYLSSKNIGSGSLLIMKKADKRWLFIIPSRMLTEEGVYSILSEIRAFSYKDPKVILVAASDIDSGAKLLAKQKHFWVWSRDDIGRLFEFYKGYNAVIA